MRLTAVGVTFISFAAAVKLPCRPAASNARNPFNDGNRLAIFFTPIFSLAEDDLKPFAPQPLVPKIPA